MYDYFPFPLSRASKWNRPIFDPSEVKIDLYMVCLFMNMSVYIYNIESSDFYWCYKQS